MQLDEKLLPNLQPPSSLDNEKYPHEISSNDNNAILYTASYTLEQLKALVDTYIASKKEKAMHAINIEMSQLAETSSRSLHVSHLNSSAVSMVTVTKQSKQNLQESLKRIMDEAKIEEDTYWNSMMNSRANNISNNGMKETSIDKKQIEAVKTLYRKNMQVAAQICVLRQLQQEGK